MDLKQDMMNRIFSMAQPEEWTHALAVAADSAREMAQRRDFTAIRQIYLVGCGTSLANAMIGASFIEAIAKVPARAVPAFSFSKYTENDLLDGSVWVLGVTGAGRTKSVERCLRTAREAGAVTVAVTGEPERSCGQAAHEVLMTDGNKEGPTVRTVSNLFLQLGLLSFALELGRVRGVLSPEKDAYWQSQIDRVIAAAPQVLALKPQLDELAAHCDSLKGEMVLVLGAGPNEGTAFEGALMCVELGWIDAAGYELEEFTHGRFRQMDHRKPMIFIAPSGKAYNKVVNILPACLKAQAPTIILTDTATDKLKERAGFIVPMPGGIDELLTPLLYVIPLWLFGFETGLIRGIDPTSIRYGITAVDLNGADD